MILSADVAPEMKKEAIDAGAEAFLSKPIEATKLLDLVAAICGRKEEMPVPVPTAYRRSVVAVADAPAILNLDTIRLLEELGSGSDFMEKLIEAFIKDSVQILARVEKDMDKLSSGEFRSLLHALKGSVSSIGADRLTQYYSRIGAMTDQEVHAESKNIARGLREEFDVVRMSLSDYIKRLKRTTGGA